MASPVAYSWSSLTGPSFQDRPFTSGASQILLSHKSLIHRSNSIHRQTLCGHQPIDKAGPFSYCLAPVKHVFTKHLHKNELFPNVNKEACQKIGCSAPQYGELL